MSFLRRDLEYPAERTPRLHPGVAFLVRNVAQNYQVRIAHTESTTTAQTDAVVWKELCLKVKLLPKFFFTIPSHQSGQCSVSKCLKKLSLKNYQECSSAICLQTRYPSWYISNNVKCLMQRMKKQIMTRILLKSSLLCAKYLRPCETGAYEITN